MKDFGNGTRARHIGGITVCCMAPEARDLIETIMREWRIQWAKLPENHRVKDPEDAYGFVYWLIRWSGLVDSAYIKTGKKVARVKSERKTDVAAND